MTQLGEWQAIQLNETWTKDILTARTTRRKDRIEFGTLSHNHDDAINFDDVDTTEKMAAQGWTCVDQKEEVLELMPFKTYFDLAEEIVNLPEEKRTKENLERMIKQYVHIEKHDVYSRLEMYFERYLPKHMQEILTLKVQTHRDLARSLSSRS